jgi:hypothetical protein
MPADNNSPQLLFFYTLSIFYMLLPRIISHLPISTTACLLLYILISGSFLSMAAFLSIHTCYTISRVSFLFLAWILRKTSSSFDLGSSKINQWKLLGSETSRFYTKLIVSVMIGYILTIKLLVKRKQAGDGIWETAKHSIEEKRIAAQNPTEEAEQTDETKSTDFGSVVLWGYCAFTYTMALFDSKKWLVSAVRGSAQQERTRGWDMWCLWGPSFISGAVGMARWRYLVKTTKGKAQSEERHVGGKETSEKLQV